MKNKKRILKKARGITLITLVITIIILLLLAGISILAISNNGIFKKVKQAKEASIIAEKKEEVQLALTEVLIECERR